MENNNKENNVGENNTNNNYNKENGIESNIANNNINYNKENNVEGNNINYNDNYNIDPNFEIQSDKINMEQVKSDLSNVNLMAIFSYIGILCLIPYFSEKKDEFVMYHAKQGLNLFIIEIFAYFIGVFLERILRMPGFFTALIEIAALIFSVIGIVYVVKREKKELPIINNIKIIK